jgi:chorismate-pyruvate lyase
MQKVSLILSVMHVQMRAAFVLEFLLQFIRSHLGYLDTIEPGVERDATSFIAPLNELKPFLRALLVADGTVTLLLRAYFDEDVLVETTSQSSFVVESALPHLVLMKGDDAFFRQVELTGNKTGHTYAQATSVLNPAALKPELFAALIKEDVGMGDVLRNSARGSYREILDVRAVDDARMARTYTVVLDSKPAILITEVFNTRWF